MLEKWKIHGTEAMAQLHRSCNIGAGIDDNEGELYM